MINMPDAASRYSSGMPSGQRESELRRQASLLNREIDAALAARRIKAQVDDAARRDENFQVHSCLVFNGAVWLSTMVVIGVLTVCILM